MRQFKNITRLYKPKHDDLEKIGPQNEERTFNKSPVGTSTQLEKRFKFKRT